MTSVSVAALPPPHLRVGAPINYGEMAPWISTDRVFALQDSLGQPRELPPWDRPKFRRPWANANAIGANAAVLVVAGPHRFASNVLMARSAATATVSPAPEPTGSSGRGNHRASSKPARLGVAAQPASFKDGAAAAEPAAAPTSSLAVRLRSASVPRIKVASVALCRTRTTPAAATETDGPTLPLPPPPPPPPVADMPVDVTRLPALPTELPPGADRPAHVVAAATTATLVAARTPAYTNVVSQLYARFARRSSTTPPSAAKTGSRRTDSLRASGALAAAPSSLPPGPGLATAGTDAPLAVQTPPARTGPAHFPVPLPLPPAEPALSAASAAALPELPTLLPPQVAASLTITVLDDGDDDDGRSAAFNPDVQIRPRSRRMVNVSRRVVDLRRRAVVVDATAPPAADSASAVLDDHDGDEDRHGHRPTIVLGAALAERPILGHDPLLAGARQQVQAARRPALVCRRGAICSADLVTGAGLRCMVCLGTKASVAPICEQDGGFHRCCAVCTVAWVQRQLAIGAPTLRCPDGGCQGRIRAATVVDAVEAYGHGELVAPVQMLLQQPTTTMIFPLACPRASCGGKLYLPSVEAVADLSHIHCPACLVASRIPRWQRRLRDRAFQAHRQRRAAPAADEATSEPPAGLDRAPSLLEQLWHELFLVFNTRTCPGCGVAIERIAGCNHMTCPCGVNFCWQCQHPMRSHRLLGDHHTRWGVHGCRAELTPDHPMLGQAARVGVLLTASAAVVATSPLLAVAAAVWFPVRAIRQRLRDLSED